MDFISANAVMLSGLILLIAYIFIALEKIPKVTGSHVHNFTKLVVPANCMSGGYTVNECSCGAFWMDSMSICLSNPIREDFPPAHWLLLLQLSMPWQPPDRQNGSKPRWIHTDPAPGKCRSDGSHPGRR